jgi:hypothetical protein
MDGAAEQLLERMIFDKDKFLDNPADWQERGGTEKERDV